MRRRWGTRLGRWLRNLSLLTRFTLIGAIVGLLVASGVAWLITTRVTQLVLQQAAIQAVDQIELGVLANVDAADFQAPYTPERLDNLDGRLRPLLERVRRDGSGVLRVHVFAPDGTVIYSDLPAKRGQKVATSTNILLTNALNGDIGTQISGFSSAENADLKAQHGSALEVYVPLRIDGQVVGAYEIYRDLAPLRPIQPLVLGTVAVGFLILFLSLPAVMRGAALLIRRQQAERERLVQQAAETEALRELDRLKSELLSSVSHELRTPLSLVYGYAELLTSDGRPIEPTRAQQMLREIHRGSQTMRRMVDDLLDFSRIERGQLRLRLTETDLGEVVRAAIDALSQQPGSERIETDLPATPLLAIADADRVGQIAINLITNALRYAPEGAVRVRLTEEPGQIASLTVQDSGPGISPEVLPRVWEMFYRGPERIDSPIRGAGIGLSLVKSLAEAHSGSADATSTPGQETIFRVRLPLCGPTLTELVAPPITSTNNVSRPSAGLFARGGGEPTPPDVPGSPRG